MLSGERYAPSYIIAYAQDCSRVVSQQESEAHPIQEVLVGGPILSLSCIFVAEA